MINNNNRSNNINKNNNNKRGDRTGGGVTRVTRGGRTDGEEGKGEEEILAKDGRTHGPIKGDTRGPRGPKTSLNQGWFESSSRMGIQYWQINVSSSQLMIRHKRNLKSLK